MNSDAKIWIQHNGKWVKDVYKDQDNYLLRNDDKEDQVDNMIQLPHLNEPSILNGVFLRFQKNQIYTFTGEILLSVNPCQDLGLYSDEISNRYRNYETKKPHLYYIAQKALDNLHLQNQSILVSGESGAGKTHAAREIMKFLGSERSGRSKGSEKIIQSNPILECLGNASTIYNPNSSRFGKFINMYFDGKTLVGADIKTYLLEKRRVTHQNDDEHNFHIFYQVGLEGEFRYRNGDHQQDSKEVEEACQLLSVDWPHIRDTVQGILWLGNNDLTKAAPLLGLDLERLTRVLKERTITTGGETITIPLSEEECVVVRDSLAMTLYQQLFDHTVQQINHSVSQRKTSLSISILDIFGFECFDHNSLEQFCINYSNERLQNQFNHFVFTLEQEEYKREGISWDDIDFPDNSDCIDMIQGRLGIIDLLEEECKLPKGSDKSFTGKLNRELDQHPNYSFNKRFADSKFIVQHYAGPVEYCSNGFVDKNRNIVSHDVKDLITSTSTTRTRGRGQKAGICSQFRNHLKELVSTIEASQTSYVRCIKPNVSLVPECWDAQKVVTQLRYCGVLEVIRIARSGYSVRMKHDDFDFLYQGIGVGNEGIVRGHTKVFMKHDSYEILEGLRREKLIKTTIVLQSWIRSRIRRKKYILFKDNLYKLVRVVRRRHFCRVSILVKLQAWGRGRISQNKFVNIKFIARWIQVLYRYRKHRKTIESVRRLQKIIKASYIVKVVAVTLIASFYRSYTTRKSFKNLKKYTIRIQKNYRRKVKDISIMKDNWVKEKEVMEQKTDAMRSQMIRCIDNHVVEKMKMADELDALKMENLRLQSRIAANENEKKSLPQLLKDWFLS